MPRTLPWVTKGAAKKDALSSSPAPKRRKREASPEDIVDANLNDVATPPPLPKQRLRAERSPSTSPVRPTSAVGPLEVEYMRPGYDADDIYMMVEDVFLTTAKLYTTNFHVEGYARSRRLAKARGEKTLAALHHGTDERTEKSKGLQLRQEREGKHSEMRGVLDEEAESSDEDAAYKHDPQLAGLMNKGVGRSSGRQLAGMIKARSNTRAAAGFMESPHAAKRHRNAVDDEDDDDAQARAKASSSKLPKVFEEVSDKEDEDGLDATPARPVRKPEAKQRGTKRGNRSDLQDVDDSRRNNIFKRFAEPLHEQNSGPPPRPAATLIKVEDMEDSHDLPRPRPPRPTYKKAQDRAASQALNTQSGGKLPSLPQGHTSSRNGMFARTPIPFTAKGSKSSDVQSASPTKKTVHSTTAEESQTSLGMAKVRTAAAERITWRRADRARKEKEQQGKTRRADDIPTFMF